MSKRSKREAPYLTGVFIEKFQSIKSPAYLKIAGLTMLYGPNSAGKSSVLDALDFINKITDDDKHRLRVDYLWETYCEHQTRIGMSYRAMPIVKEDGTRQARWLEREVGYSTPHVEFLKNIVDKEVMVEFGDHGDSLKIAIEGRPLLELYGHFQFRSYKENLALAITEEELDDAEAYGREIHGRLIAHIENPFFESLLPDLYRFYRLASRKAGVLVSSSEFERSERKKIEDTEDLRLIFQDHGSCFSLYGIQLWDDWLSSVGRRFSVVVDDGAESFLGRGYIQAGPRLTKKAAMTGEAATRSFLLGELRDIASLIDAIVEGIRFQVCRALVHSRVTGGRGIIDSDVPVYASGVGGYSRLASQPMNHDHLAAYAQFRSQSPRYRWFFRPHDSMGRDFVSEALGRYVKSLAGYKVNADVHVSKPIGKNKTRVDPWQPDTDNVMVFLNVEDEMSRVRAFHEVGSGLSYILPVLTSLWASALSFVEQPELHLHPAAQCELGDVFIGAKNLGSFSIVESHSEHLLLRILRRIRESSSKKLGDKSLKISPDELKIYYFNPEAGIGTRVIEIRVDRFGDLLTRWPGGFFAERDQELFS